MRVAVWQAILLHKVPRLTISYARVALARAAKIASTVARLTPILSLNQTSDYPAVCAVSVTSVPLCFKFFGYSCSIFLNTEAQRAQRFLHGRSQFERVWGNVLFLSIRNER